MPNLRVAELVTESRWFAHDGTGDKLGSISKQGDRYLPACSPPAPSP